MTTPDLTLAELAARVDRIETVLGLAPAPTPPSPVITAPGRPTGLRATTLVDGRIQLDWDPVPNADSYDVLDLLNLTQPVKETVTTLRSIRSAIDAGDRRAYAIRARNAAGLSPLSLTLYLPTPSPTPAPGPTPAPAPGVRYPADIFGKNWYLTLPVPRADGLATEIHQPALATYTSKYCELTPDRTGIVFRVWHGGATTKGSKNPRSELREEINDGAGHAAWSSTDGRHRMVVEGQVNRLTKVRPYVVIAQIHDAADDVTVFRVENSQLWITAGNTPHGYLLDPNFALGRRYQIGFDVSGGVISYLYNGKVVPYTLSAATTGAYFKAGNYLQSNPTTAPTESTDEYAEVVIYSVAVTHS